MEETIGKLTAGTEKGDETMCHEEQTKEEIEAAENEVQKEDFQDEDLDKSLQSILPEVTAIPEHEVRKYIASIVYVVALSMRILRAFTEDRERIASLFSPQGFLLKTYDDLIDRIKGLWQADVLLRQGVEGKRPGRELMERARWAWQKLIRDAEYVFGNDPDRKEIVADLRAGKGTLNRADDLLSVSVLFSNNWDEIKDRCNVSREEIDEARSLALRIIEIVSPQVNVNELEELRAVRNGAFEYLRRGIDDIRAAAAFAFRDEPSRLKNYPSLFSGRKNRRRTTKNGNGATDTPVEAVQPIIVPEQPEPIIQAVQS